MHRKPESRVRTGAYRALVWRITLIGSFAPHHAAAQMPPVGFIDVYGARRHPVDQIRQASGLRVGDAVTRSTMSAAKMRLKALPGVHDVWVDANCCLAGKTIMYVGVLDDTSSAISFRKAPNGDVHLTPDIIDAEDALAAAREAAMARGMMEEDDSRGHALMRDSAGRRIQEGLVVLAARHLGLLKKALSDARDPKDRAMAAEVMGYAADKRVVVQDLMVAVYDPEETVRNNAIRALAVIAKFARANPELGIVVSPVPFIDLLNSLVWTDRNKALFLLAELTRPRDPKLLRMIAERAMPSLIEMGRWQNLGHAGFALQILGRIAGLSDTEISSAIARGDREEIIGAASRRIH
jgi:hypothetical protein